MVLQTEDLYKVIKENQCYALSYRHAGAGWHPETLGLQANWIPAFTGMMGWEYFAINTIIKRWIYNTL